MSFRAAVLSIGDELTLGQISERNAGWIAQEFLRRGILVMEHRTVSDDKTAISAAISQLATDASVVVLTGGLGPTDDDLTREALADALGGVDLVEDADARESLRKRFEARGRPMPALNAKQALCPVGAKCIANPNGTAPGLCARIGQAIIFCLPGPPNEMQPMVHDAIFPVVDSMVSLAGGVSVSVCAIHSCGLPESVAAERIRPMMDRNANPLAGTTASGAIVTARIRAVGSAARDGSMERAAQEVEHAWAPYAFGRDDTTLAQVLGEILLRTKDQVAVAESCTGGGIGAFLTSAAGSSAWFGGGWITYSNQMKISLLGVSPELLELHGAVSESVACAMALGAAERAGVRFAVSATGIAGPAGGSETKPVGTVWIAVADRNEKNPSKIVRARCFLFTGDRAMIRERAVRVAVQLVRLAAIGQSDVPVLWEIPKNAERVK